MRLLFAQQDTLVMPEVEVRADVPVLYDVSYTDVLDSTGRHYADASELLSMQSLAMVKNYGPSGISSLSIRGSSPSQSQVVWNGFVLQSFQNGQSDISLLPLSLMDQVRLQYGGCGALWGNGGIGGSLHLNALARFSPGIHVQASQQYGSFGRWYSSLKAQYATRRISIGLRAVRQEEENNFPYYNEQIYPKTWQRQRHAALALMGMMPEFHVRLSRNSRISIWYWKQWSDRQIAPVMSIPNSFAEQVDWSDRLAAEWILRKFRFRTGYFSERILFQDTTFNINAFSGFHAWVNECDYTGQANKYWQYSLGLHSTISTGFADNYGQETPSRNQWAAFWTNKVVYKRLELNANVRQEWMITPERWRSVPFMPSVSLQYQVSKRMDALVKVNRHFRWPTMNDLFWKPGGNESLRPEHGWGQEFGLDWHPCCENPKLRSWNISLRVYSRYIHDWIIWKPSNSYWTPVNLHSVWSRGGELRSFWKLPIPGKVKFMLRHGYAITYSTQEKTDRSNANELHKQLIYVPPYSMQMGLQCNYKGWSLESANAWMSWRYTDADNKHYLEGYFLADIYVSKEIPIKDFSLEWSFKIQNIFNKQYQVLEGRAMPGRSLLLGMNMQLNRKRKTK
ncbi:MAG: TonB-dependent receptor [Cytophagaceae bacterium]|jgi:iron complex outermembrane receptor protein|nr:TonB-dependent receptor [Cytophagaceae bacterium]